MAEKDEIEQPNIAEPHPSAGAPEVEPGRLVPTHGEPDWNDPSLDGRSIVEAALARQTPAE